MPPKEFSVYRSFLYLIVGIFATEFIIMMTLEYLVLPESKYVHFLDSFFLVIIVSPLVYFFTIKPLQSKIAELKKAELAIQKYADEIKSEHHAIVQALEGSAIVSMTDEKGSITYANQKFIDISKYTKDELIGQNHRILKSGHQPPELFDDLWATISSGKIWRGEIKNRAKDGSYYWVDATIVPVLDQGGKPKSYVALRIVITERKDAEEKIREYIRKIEREKTKDEALLESIGEGMIATDETGRITTVNRAAEQILGWKAEELIGKMSYEMISAVDENGNTVPPEKREVLVAMATNTMVTMEAAQYTRKDGRRIPLSITVNPVIVDGKTIGTIGVFRDVTKERELEQTRQDLLSLASHQLRTPLSGTKWLIETLTKGLHGPLTKGQTEYLNEIYKINERMTLLVQDMMGVLRMESGASPIKKGSVSATHLIKNIFETLSGAAKSKQVALRLIESEDCTINTDPLFLQNILENIVANAINYSNPDSEAVVSIAKEPHEVIFTVKDSGIGIPEDEQRQIFERFYRASNAKTFDTRGSGLGLYIANMLASKIGAKLSFDSEAGKGTTFYVRIPYSSEEGLQEETARV